MSNKIPHLGSGPYSNRPDVENRSERAPIRDTSSLRSEKRFWRSVGDPIHIFTGWKKSRLFGADIFVKTRVLSELIQNHILMNPAMIQEIYQGAHVIVQGDQGKLYSMIQHQPNLEPYERRSSHESQSPQLGVVLEPGNGTLLLGIHKDGHTWFQFEGAAVGLHVSLRENIRHFVDYLKYKLTKRNQGPAGSSEHTDKNPLRLNFRG